MMVNIIKVRVLLTDFEDYIWRDIELISSSKLSTLCYAILVAFDTRCVHYFNLEYKGVIYQPFEDDEFQFDFVIDPEDVKLSDLNFAVGDKMLMKYDFTKGWSFDIEVVEITPFNKSIPVSYPICSDGAGKGIVENAIPSDMLGVIRLTIKENVVPTYFDSYNQKEITYDFRDFDKDTLNLTFDKRIKSFKRKYENS